VAEYTEAASWLAILEADDIPRRAAKRALQRWCLEDTRSMREFMGLGGEDLAEHLDLPTATLATMLAKAADVPPWEQRLATLAERGIRILLRHDAAYPDLLAERLDPAHQPYYLYYQGELELLSEPSVLVAGAAQPSGDGQRLAKAVGQQAAPLEAALVGGYDEGVERIAQNATLAAGGSAILVLPLGIERFAGALSGLQEPLREGRLLVLSPYAPDAELSDLRAQARREIVAALAGVCLLIEPDVAPDAWRGHEALKAGHAPIGIWRQGDQAMLQAWTQSGAQQVDDIDAALALVTAWAAPAENEAVEAIPLEEAEAHGVEPIRFKDADDAIQRLSETGQVPEQLRRRLEETDWEDVP